jgi:hypothetical protein
MAIMYERSWVLGLSACIFGQEGTTDITLIGRQEEDHSEEHERSKLHPHHLLAKIWKGRGKAQRKVHLKKGKNPMVRVMSRMVDDVISVNSVSSKALSGDFTRESVREVMALVKDAEQKNEVMSITLQHNCSRMRQTVKYFWRARQMNEGSIG